MQPYDFTFPHKPNRRVNLYLLVIECDFLMAEDTAAVSNKAFFLATRTSGLFKPVLTPLCQINEHSSGKTLKKEKNRKTFLNFAHEPQVQRRVASSDRLLPVGFFIFVSPSV